MKRVELLEKLKLVEPALSGSDQIPILTHFLFYGLSVLAYNDRIAISTQCKTDFTGALHGTTLLRMLESSGVDEITLAKEDKDIVLKMAKARIKLGVLPIELDFTMPKPDPSAKLELDIEELLTAIKGCMRSVTDVVSEYQGVTLIAEGKRLSVFSTNKTSISYESVNWKPSNMKRLVLSAEFCKEMLSLAKGDSPTLEIHDDYVVFSTKQATLWGKLVIVDKEHDFEGITKSMLSDKNIEALIKLPNGIKRALDRAVIILEDKTASDGNVNAVIRDGSMVMKSESARGVATDIINMDSHPDIKVRFNPKWVRVGCDEFDLMYVTNRAVIMTRATVDKKQKETLFNSAYFISTQALSDK